MTANDLGLAISLASLVISIAAFWRAGRFKVFDLRTQVLRDIVELRTRANDLVPRITSAVQSRAAINSALGGGGATAAFTESANQDKAEIAALSGQLAKLRPGSWLISYGKVEVQQLLADKVRTRLEQLSRKYEEAAADDERRRQHVRDAKVAEVNRLLSK